MWKNSMKKIFVIDWILLAVAAFSAYSGIELHVAGHGDVHEIWHNWAVVHVITSLLFLIFGIVHVKMHIGIRVCLQKVLGIKVV